MQQTTLFKAQIDIPASHFYAFQACNNADHWHMRRHFYQLKNEILLQHGHFANYDLQEIKTTCHSCNGTGYWYDNRCNRCINGIYQVKTVALQRYILNGQVFHIPQGEVVGQQIKVYETGSLAKDLEYFGYEISRLQAFNGRIVGTINGIITHQPLPLHPTFAYYFLLWHYNRNLFYYTINTYVKATQTNTQYKLRILLRKYHPLRAFYKYFNIQPEHSTAIDDDLPF